MRPEWIHCTLNALTDRDRAWPDRDVVERIKGAYDCEHHLYITKHSVFMLQTLMSYDWIDSLKEMLKGCSKSERSIFLDTYPLRWFCNLSYDANLEANWVFQTKTILPTRYLFYDVLLWLDLGPITTIETKPACLQLSGNATIADTIQKLRKAEWMAFTDSDIGGKNA